MKSNTLFGIILGLAAIFGAYFWEGGSGSTLFMLPAMLIVFGGTLAAGFAGSSWDVFKNIPMVIKAAFFPKKYHIEKIINQIIMFSGLARREGILSLEDKVDNVEHPYMTKLFRACIDGADQETLIQIYDAEANSISERHNTYITLFNKLGGYSPTMGIIGTVMGLIHTLASAGSDPNILIHHIASAFIATMWGILMANIVWLPIADKLQTLHNREMYLLSVILDGVKSVQIGEVPTVIQNKLASAFPLSEQSRIVSRKIEPKPTVQAIPTAETAVLYDSAADTSVSE